MPALRGFLWLVGFLLLGQALVWSLRLPVSPGVVGMLAMTLWLILRGRVSEDIQAASQPLIAVLAMLIMPGVVGVFFIAEAFAGQWLAVGVALVLGTLLSVATTLWLMLRFMPMDTPDD
ncbi:CidA/LrgA family protein [Halomonas sp. TRM85114]|uniref:CidA/LrgA family protein n=1 Tax=Halomonas jincaotanensis TaxID=2810616 RepID=UPI001BD3A735|nr:CidA/LrgA family protein [Halomonas jincaotanensis]MBS9405051.1 CidA/LrgA family protein [Halomonas jincaotanensis]